LPKKDKLQENAKKMSTETDPTKYDDKLIKEYTKQYKFIKVGVIKTFLVKKGKNFESGKCKI